MTDKKETTEDWVSRWDQERKEALLASAKGMDVVRKKLVKMGISSVELSYDGSGDSGQIENCQCYKKTNGKESLFNIELAQEDSDKIESFAYGLLETKHGGWEINSGAFGIIRIDLTAKKIKTKIEHNERVEDTEYSESEDEF